MFDRLKKLLNTNEAAEVTPRLETVLSELDAAVSSTEQQCRAIIQQEKALQNKLNHYHQQYKSKIERAKHALKSKDRLNAEHLYQESELLQKQIGQYAEIVQNLHNTRQRLMSQLNQFRYTKDELMTRKTLGEANVDASQLKASLAEQLMYLNESNELSVFDDLIAEATSKSQAIEEIRGAEDSLDAYLNQEESDVQDSSAITKLENLMHAEKAAKLEASQKNHQILIEQVFGKTEPSSDPDQKEKQRTLLENLKRTDATHTRKEQTVHDFFEDQVTPESASDHEDRISNFFGNNNEATDSDQQFKINKFFKNH